ncbi:MAG: DegT/DnrJ/EryC1/StrS family aminotransferase [Candidatus Marinimicrobia bacterium]|nr:DegT/DnrJ/EryC1/StrS family aminotransferase [Candidatus Neomarinimicrobiota bacterium]
MKTPFFPVGIPNLVGNEKKYVNDALDTNWISSAGKYVNSFEENFSKYLNINHTITVSNGTVALHLALVALGIDKDDEVIVSNHNGAYGPFAIEYVGAKPVFFESKNNTWNIDPSQIEEKITKKTKAIMIVHIYGYACDMTAIMKIAKKHNLKVIEDAAESHGAIIDGKKCGTFGDISIFSFYANKIITSGEGGAVVTNSNELAQKCRYYKNLCFKIDGPRDFQHLDIGYNYRLSNIHAAILCAQLEKIDYYIDKRNSNFNNFKNYFASSSISKFFSFPEPEPNSFNVAWVNVIKLENTDIAINDLRKEILKDGIDSRNLFFPSNKQPFLSDKSSHKESFYVSEELYDKGMYVPSGSNLTTEDILFIAAIIEKKFKFLQDKKGV